MSKAEIIARLEKLTGPDAHLDEVIWEAVGGWVPREYRSCDYMKAFGTPLTVSLDAAVALVERLLPGVFYFLAKGKVRSGEPLYAMQLLFGDQVLATAEHDLREAAILIALFRALEANEANHD